MNPLLLCVACLSFASAPSPRLRADYRLHIDSAGATSFDVELHVQGASKTLRLAMAAHPEYDDRFWRYVRDVRVTSGGADVAVIREDSMVWSATITGGEATVRYRVEPPPSTAGRGSWRAYLSPTSGLVGGPHSFMFIVGHADAPASLFLALPRGWEAATGMRQSASGAYQARDFGELMDSPILVGALHRWPFVVRRVQHEVAYVSAPSSPLPDSEALVRALSGIVEQSRAVFGGFPYGRYVFLLQEGAGGGLEHGTSLTNGINTTQIASQGMTGFLAGTAHEYFHTWNEVYLRPKGWGGVSYQPSPPPSEMWWFEGVTIFYADVLLRRAKLPTYAPSRSGQLTRDIGNYLDDASNAQVSPEAAGRRVWDPAGSHTGPRPDVYLQGRLIGAALDLVIRNATGNTRSLDDAMRLLFARNSGPRGYLGVDVEVAIHETCGCAVHDFFDRYIRSAHSLPFDDVLRPAGLRADVRVVRAVDTLGIARPDARVWGFVRPAETSPRVLIETPDGAWARAGLATDDRIVRWNGRGLGTMRDLRGAIGGLHLGDTVNVVFERGARTDSVTVHVAGYDEHRVRLVDLPVVTSVQRAVRRAALLDDQSRE